jgi:hypothetical protein
MTAYGGIPFLVISASNVVIISSVIGSQRKRQAMRENTADKEAKDLQNITVMLLVVSIVFITLTLPSQLYFILIYDDYQAYGTSRHKRALLYLFRYSAQIMSYSNNGINFLLYCLSGSQFRAVFLERLKKTFFFLRNLLFIEV